MSNRDHQNEVAEKCALIVYALGNEDVFHWLTTSTSASPPKQLEGLKVSKRSFFDVAVLLNHKVEWRLAFLLLRTFWRTFCSPPPCRFIPKKFDDVVDAINGALWEKE